MVYVFLANGFEEAEALVPCDMLRRAEIDAKLVSITGDVIVTGARGIRAVADITVDKADIEKADMIVLPGGFPGFENLAKSEKVMSAIDFMVKEGRFVTAICGAPAIVLGKNGYLKDKKAVCYPGMEEDLCCKRLHNGVVCVDGNMITSKSAGTAMSFSIVLVRELFGDTAANKLQRAIVLDV